MNILLSLIISLFLILPAFADTIDGHEAVNTEIQEYYAISTAPSVSTVNTARIYYNPTDDKLKISENGGAWTNIGAGAVSSQWSGTAGSIIYYNSANVGIGTSAPSEKLQVSDGYIKGNLQANVGIGKTNPATALDVNGDITCSTLNYSALSPAINVGTGTANYVSKWLTTSTLQDSSIFDNGNVGIGTTAPINKLEVSGNIKSTGAKIDTINYKVNTTASFAPCIVLTFDDGYEADLTKAANYLNTKGVSATSFVVSDWVGTEGKMSWAQLLTLQNTDGWEIGVHGKDHSQWSVENMAVQIGDCITAFTSNGVTSPKSGAYPGGVFTTATASEISKYLRYSRSTVDALVSRPVRPTTIETRAFSATSSVNIGYIDAAIAAKKVLVLFTHGVTDDFIANILTPLVEYAQANNVPILTMSQAMEQYGNISELSNSVNGGVTALSPDGKTAFENMDKITFVGSSSSYQATIGMDSDEYLRIQGLSSRPVTINPTGSVTYIKAPSLYGDAGYGGVACVANFVPGGGTGTYDLGTSSYKWKDTYLAGTLYTSGLTATGAVTVGDIIANRVSLNTDGQGVEIGGNSMLFNGTTDSLTLTYQSALNVGPMTFEGRFKITTPGVFNAIASRAGLMMIGLSNSHVPNWSVYFWDGTTENYLTGTGAALTPGVWYKLRITWDRTLGSNQLKAYINDTLWAQETDTNEYPTGSSDWNFVKHQGSATYYGFTLDEVRLSNVVRPTSDYPRTTPFVNDADTVFLYHFDETSGTPVDGSSNAFTTTVVGTPTYILGDISKKNVIKRTDPNIILGSTGEAVIPQEDNTSDFGSPTYRWANGYFGGNVGIGTTDTTLAVLTTPSIRVSTGASNTYVLTSDANGVGTWAAAAASGATTALDNLASVAINTTLVSDTDDTDALGTTAIAWSDLFLGNGSVITWNSAPSTSDVTLTHSANLLSLAGGNLAIDGNVGIGTTDVTKATASFSSIRVGTGTTNGYVLTANADGVGSWAAATGGTGGVTPSKSFILTNPSSATDGPMWRVPAAITITAVHGVCADGTNIIGHLDECDADGANCAGVDGATDMTITTSNVNDDGTLSNPSIDAGDYVGWHTTSVSGSVTKAIITYDYEE